MRFYAVFIAGIFAGIATIIILMDGKQLFSKHIEYSDYNRLAMEVHDCFYKARSTAPLMWTDDFQPVGAILCDADKEGVCKEKLHYADYVKLIPNPQEVAYLGPNSVTGKGNAMDIKEVTK